ncbi:unnamed protein product [Phaedon cochleariae]|uniref:Protein kinase domain-containing protein n=1 Tax=Phaedon cochleariae TaxID=80249 RepID=A0A9N9SBJ0_PHACE|nr:unnamed protein product [Phaedon cochleariae]
MSVAASYALSRVGCPHFMAPEVIERRQYGKPVDIWAAGILLHVILSGTLPFHGSGRRLNEALCRGKLHLDSAPQWQFISDSAKDLVQQMLNVDPKQRITIQEILNHRWLRDRDKGLRIHLGDTIEELKKFNARRKLKSCILAAVNSCKWYPYDDTNADTFSDFGDDEVSSCAVSTILDSLDDIYCLQDEAQPQEKAHLLALLEDTRLHLFDRISSRMSTPVRAPTIDAVQSARDAADALRELEHRRDADRRELQELRDLLCRPHFKRNIFRRLCVGGAAVPTLLSRILTARSSRSPACGQRPGIRSLRRARISRRLSVVASRGGRKAN